jgi:hypothetical protein
MRLSFSSRMHVTLGHACGWGRLKAWRRRLDRAGGGSKGLLQQLQKGSFKLDAPSCIFGFQPSRVC